MARIGLCRGRIHTGQPSTSQSRRDATPCLCNGADVRSVSASIVIGRGMSAPSPSSTDSRVAPASAARWTVGRGCTGWATSGGLPRGGRPRLDARPRPGRRQPMRRRDPGSGPMPAATRGRRRRGRHGTRPRGQARAGDRRRAGDRTPLSTESLASSLAGGWPAIAEAASGRARRGVWPGRWDRPAGSIRPPCPAVRPCLAAASAVAAVAPVHAGRASPVHEGQRPTPKPRRQAVGRAVQPAPGTEAHARCDRIIP